MHSDNEFERVVEGKEKQPDAAAKRESWRGRKLLMSKCASLDVVCSLIRHLIRRTQKTIGVELNTKLSK